MDLINTFTSDVLNKALDGYAARQKAISSNLANVETPNYHRRDVAFEDALGQAIDRHSSEEAGSLPMRQADNGTPLAMRTTMPGHFEIGTPDGGNIDDVTPQVTESDDMKFRNDGNAVDVDSEMAMMARNTQRYIALANIENRDGKSIRSVLENNT